MNNSNQTYVGGLAFIIAHKETYIPYILLLIFGIFSMVFGKSYLVIISMNKTNQSFF